MIAAGFIISCDYPILEYVNDPAIYFRSKDPKSVQSKSDTLRFSFKLSEENRSRDTQRVTILSMGNLEPYDRPIKVVQTNLDQPNAARPGLHYIPFDDPGIIDSFCIPANKAFVRIPIILLRDPSLTYEEKHLALAVVKNEYFRPGMPPWDQYMIKFSDMYTKPELWDNIWDYFFGKSWGQVKMGFIIRTTGYTAWDKTPPIAYGHYMAIQTKAALEKYNAENPENPLKENDGTLVTIDN